MKHPGESGVNSFAAERRRCTGTYGVVMAPKKVIVEIIYSARVFFGRVFEVLDTSYVIGCLKSNKWYVEDHAHTVMTRPEGDSLIDSCCCVKRHHPQTAGLWKH